MGTAENQDTAQGIITLKLFVTGRTPSAMRARQALEALLETHTDSDLRLEVVDVLADPEAALIDNVYATPTIIRSGGGIERRLIGDLSSVEKLEIGLHLAAAA